MTNADDFGGGEMRQATHFPCRRCKGRMNVWIDLSGDDIPMCFSCLKDIVEDLLGKALVAGHAYVGKDAMELAEKLLRRDG